MGVVGGRGVHDEQRRREARPELLRELRRRLRHRIGRALVVGAARAARERLVARLKRKKERDMMHE